MADKQTMQWTGRTKKASFPLSPLAPPLPCLHSDEHTYVVPDEAAAAKTRTGKTQTLPASLSED